MKKRLGLPALFGLSAGVLAWSQTGQPPPPFYPEYIQCYISAPAPAFTPTKVPAAASMTQAHQSVVEASVQPALAAAGACLQTRCEADGRKALQAAMRPYLGARRRITTSLYRASGDAGLATARHLFSSPAEVKLQQDLATLHERGLLDMPAYNEEKEALALFVMQPPTGFRPCKSIPRPKMITY